MHNAGKAYSSHCWLKFSCNTHLAFRDAGFYPRLERPVINRALVSTPNEIEKSNGEDFKPYFRALKKIGFNGVITMEWNWTKIEEEAPVALKYLQAQLDEVYKEK